jgi:3-oxoacyl-[acyl-carrier-protein] synthase-1
MAAPFLKSSIFIEDFAVRCGIGSSNTAIGDQLASDSVRSNMVPVKLIDGRETMVARVAGLDGGAATRVDALTSALLDTLKPATARAIERHGPARIAVVIGTSNSGIEENVDHLKTRLKSGEWPQGFSFENQSMSLPALLAARQTGAAGPVFGVSTACTSGAKALATGARMLQTGLADAVICGGVDTLSELTLNGFAALESISPDTCNPFSLNRRGINIGDGGALFLLTREPSAWRLEGWGESSDAHHASAPDPAGVGGEMAVRKALAVAGAAPGDIGFVHAHGSATRLNDRMEAGLVDRVFGRDTPVMSTKPLTGHTLGASGAVQAALCLLALERGVYPPHLWDGVRDPELPEIRLTGRGERFERPVTRALSMSFAFGGSNMALILGRAS